MDCINAIKTVFNMLLSKFFLVTMLCLVSQTAAAINTVGFYFADNKNATKMFDYAKHLYANELELVEYSAEMSETLPVIIHGYSSSIEFAKSGKDNPVIVIGVSSFQAKKLLKAKDCHTWLILMDDASPQRIKTLLNVLPKNNSVAPFSYSEHIQNWQATLDKTYWMPAKPEEKTFNLIKRAAKESDTFILVPNAMKISPSLANMLFHYLYKKEVLTIGYSKWSFEAGAMIVSYADYTQSLLAARHYLISKSEWPSKAYVCLQNFQVNEHLIKKIAPSITNESLNSMAYSLNVDCY